MTTSEWYVLVNPVSGNGSGQKNWPAVKSLLEKAGVSFDFIISDRRGHVVDSAEEAIKNGYRHFISVGGDGTLNELVNALFGQKSVPTEEFTVAVFPMGTGNDWVKTMGIKTGVDEAFEIFKNHYTIAQDIGKIQCKKGAENIERYFVNAAGIGIEGHIANSINQKEDNNFLSSFAKYMLSLVQSLLVYKAKNALIELKEKTVSSKLLTLSIGICRFKGGGMQITPEANPTDGKFDITLINKLSVWTVIREIKNLYSGTFLKAKEVSQYISNYIKLSEPTIPIEADGESVGVTPAEIQIIPASLNVIVNKDSEHLEIVR